MSNAAFKRNYAAVLAKAGKKAEQVVRASALGIGASLVQKSPVDTGRFRGNWQYGAGQINTDTASPPDPSGGQAVAKIAAGVQGWKPGQTIYMTNSLPYAYRLETGWSKQAPSGMVRLTVMEFEQRIAQAARSIR